MGEASVSSSRLPYTYMEYSLKLIREVYGDIFGKSAGMALGKPLGNPQKIKSGSLKWFWHKLGRGTQGSLM